MLDIGLILMWIGTALVVLVGFIAILFCILAPFRYFLRIYKFTCFLLDAEALYPGKILLNGFPKTKYENFKIFYGILRTKGWELFMTLESKPIEYRYYNCKFSIHKGATHG